MTVQELVKYIQIEKNSRNLDRLELEDNKSSKALVMDHGSTSGSKHKLDGVFKSGDPIRRGHAIVQAMTHYSDPKGFHRQDHHRLRVIGGAQVSNDYGGLQRKN
ncbi:hypothetical protein RJ639_041201 [Escallonia herrerae]|uniref:Uncharacterized protein n=1 Tax=Escallonia herrerae TaxID=1293975 RepID=A0AA89B4C6_9ASTE|nr:hypothetical protein RJ639_041201 [Escallonia herrerae]